MIRIKDKITIRFSRNFLFMLSYILIFLGEVLLSSSTLDTIIPDSALHLVSVLFKLICMGCTFLIIFSQKYTPVELAVVIFLLAVFGLSYKISDSGRLFVSLLFILSCKYISMEKLCKVSLYVTSAVILFLAALSVTGIITMTVKERTYDDDVVRYAMGFTHPNQLGMLSFQILCCYLYLKRNILSFRKYIFCAALTILVYLVTNSTTPFLLSAMLVFVSFCHYCNTKYRVLSKLDTRIFFTVGLILALIAALLVIRYFWIYPQKLTGNLRTLKARFTLSQVYINAYGIHPFGCTIDVGSSILLPGHTQNMYAYLDNGYIRILVENGWIPFAVFLTALILYIRKLATTKQWESVLIVACLCLFLFTESKISAIFFNVFLVDMGIQFYGSQYEKKHIRLPVLLKN